MKCTRCKGPARHRLPAHNARFCDECLKVFVRRQVLRAIREFKMLKRGERVLVAVSGGKDSLAAWEVLCDLGYEAEGLHLRLEMGEFSDASLAACEEMAARLGRPLHVRTLREMAGFSVEEIARANRGREFCSVCGTLKRYYMNRVCMELGIGVLATGHQLDDEAGRLLGNFIRGLELYMQMQWPVLPALDGIPRKIKPLCRVSGRELRAYALATALPVAEGTCPHSKGATLHYYQQALEMLEEKMPGTMQAFYLGFLRRKGPPPQPEETVERCQRCGAPTTVEVCITCRMIEKAAQAREKAAAGG